MRAVLGCVVLAVCFVSMVERVWAGPFARPTDPRARAHLDRGNTLYDLGKFQDAVAEYEAGALIEPATVFDYNLGQANRQLQNYPAALWHYDRFLHKGLPNGELRDAVIAFIAEMKAHLENKAQNMPATEAALPPAPGASNGQPAATRQAQAGAANTNPDRDLPRREPRHHDWVGWGIAATGVAGLGMGGYLFYDASQLDDQRAATQQKQEQIDSGAHSRRIAGTISAGCGTALVIAGIVKLAFHDEPVSASAWNITATSNGVMVLGRF